MVTHFYYSVFTRSLLGVLLLAFTQPASADQHSNVSFCVNAAPRNLDPANSLASEDMAFLADNVHQTLLRVTGEMSPQPNIAISWKELILNQHYRFKLRRKVAFHPLGKFQPSRYLNAQDVVYSLGRLIDNANTDFTFDKGTRVTAVDQYTVELHTPKPVHDLLTKLGSNYTAIVSAEYAGHHHLHRHHKNSPLRQSGTGPFKVVFSIPSKKLVLQRFDGYWGEPAKSPFVTINGIPNQQERYTALRKNQCHVALGLTPKYWQIAKSTESLHKVSGSSNSTALIFFNTAKKPTRQLKLRQAIAFAIDRKKILRQLAQPHLQNAHSLVPPNLMNHDQVAAIELNQAQAIKLISELPNPPGPITLEIDRSVTLAFPHPQRLAELIQSALQDIGLEVRINYHENIQSLIGAMFSEQMQMAIVSWQPDAAAPTPKDFLVPLLACAKAGEQAGVTRWCNEEYDRLVYRASEQGEEQAFVEAASLANRELPAIPLWHLKDYDLVSDKLAGYERQALIALKDLQITE